MRFVLNDYSDDPDSIRGYGGDRPIVDSGSVVSTCPVDYATSVPTEKVNHSMTLESCIGRILANIGVSSAISPFHKQNRWYCECQC